MWTLQRSGNVNFLFFPSLNVVHCSQTWVFVFCSNSVFLPIFGKMMGFGAKICRRRAKAAQRKCSQEFSALFRKRKTSFFGFLRQLLGLLMYDGHHWCTQVSKFGPHTHQKGFLQSPVAAPGQLFVQHPTVCFFVCSAPQLFVCCFCLTVEQCFPGNVHILYYSCRVLYSENCLSLCTFLRNPKIEAQISEPPYSTLSCWVNTWYNLDRHPIQGLLLFTPT